MKAIEQIKQHIETKLSNILGYGKIYQDEKMKVIAVKVRLKRIF
jgi:hypothetical protein